VLKRAATAAGRHSCDLRRSIDEASMKIWNSEMAFSILIEGDDRAMIYISNIEHERSPIHPSRTPQGALSYFIHQVST
jgi:hypothetical protein